jgi:hypothetical protein
MKEDSNKVLAQEKGNVYVVLQVHQVVKSRYVVSKSALGIEQKVLALQDPDKTMVHHELHCLKKTISDADQPVISCLGMVSTRFQNRDYKSFSPSICHRVLYPYMIING